MSAAERARLGGAALALAAGDSGRDRGATLTRALRGEVRRATSFDDLATAPDWLRLDADERHRLGRRAALWAIAPQLAGSIDGAWLGGLARAAGDDDLDWAIQRATPGQPEIGRFDGDRLDTAAASLLRAATPPTLRDHVAPHPGDMPDVAPATAAAALAAAMAGDPG